MEMKAGEKYVKKGINQNIIRILKIEFEQLLMFFIFQIFICRPELDTLIAISLQNLQS